MICYTGKSNQLKPLGDNSGVSLSCIATLGGFLFGVFSVKQISLTKGKVALVDDEDYDYLMQWKWHARPERRTFYAVRRPSKTPRPSIMMHRVLLETPVGMQSDHINHNGLDNRRCNLRICTIAENNYNKLPHRNCQSRYKGVNPNNDNWQAGISFQNKLIYLGTYTTEVEAARAYDKKAKELFGEFAWLNFPEEAK